MPEIPVNDDVLLESRSLRARLADRPEVLERVKSLALLPDGEHVHTTMVAAYFGVVENVVRQLVKRHREELEQNGLRVLRGPDLHVFESDNLSLSDVSCPQARRSLTVYTRRTVLNVAMLLRDSPVAREVRSYLLHAEEYARGAWSGGRDGAGGAGAGADGNGHLLRMVSLALEATGELRRELNHVHEQVDALRRTAARHEDLLRPSAATAATGNADAPREAAGAGGLATSGVDTMGRTRFAHHVAELCRRDGCGDLVVRGGPGDPGVDILGRAPDGGVLAVRCCRRPAHRYVRDGEMQRFLGAAKVIHRADTALYVATCAVAPEARDLAVRGAVTVVDRALLDAWGAGARLRVLGG